MMLKTTIIAALIRDGPNGSRNQITPIIAAKMTLVSRKEETIAIAPSPIA